MIQEILTNLGLTSEEADIYQSLLNNGSQSASELDKTSKVKRTYVYRICQELAKKNLVTIEKKGQTTRFIPQSPDFLLTQAQEQKVKAEQAQQALETILVQLKSKFNRVEAKPTISYFEGIDGVKKVYLDTIKTNKPILALVETSKVDEKVYRWITTDYVRLRVIEKIPVKSIVASGPKTPIYTKLDKHELRETRIILSRQFPFENEINIYGDKIAIINHRRGSKLLGIIIDNPFIASTFRSWFMVTWKKLQ